MATWEAFQRVNMHGISLKTNKGHAEICDGYTDRSLRVTVQVGTGPAQYQTFWDEFQARAWAEEKLR